ncbi:hypothetical protein MLD38_002302 [Melastoma candidum]|uniref:Uncharacterized protein n=1 Tax=Melastoma candidum TaxID=119954 RepID=A0ACB9SFX1_9MYRT|nr:hypothetical protein MLD38_002302 [Melastoma candidum]
MYPMKIERELVHPAHPNHRLRLEYSETPFDCDGCREAGIGLKYRCTQCSYNLHKACGSAPRTVSHPFYRRCEFDLHHAPYDSNPRVCDACGGDIHGFSYHCRCRDLDLHPCCLNLPQVLNDGSEDALFLSPKLTGSICCYCGGREGFGWGYRSRSKEYSLHVSCVKKMLVERWLASYFKVDDKRVRELHTKIPRLNSGVGKMVTNNRNGLGKYGEIAGGVLRLVVSAVLGDPTSIIAGVIRGLVSL